MPQPRFVSGKVYTYRDLKFYAMNGCICMHDEEDGDFQVLTCREFLYRAKALSASAARHASTPVEYESRKDMLDQVERMIECVREAKHQGDHFDPQVEAWFNRHRPDRKGKAVSFGSALPSKTLPRGRHTGRTAAIDRIIPNTRAPALPAVPRLILPS